jgi:hypothetical protein
MPKMLRIIDAIATKQCALDFFVREFQRLPSPLLRDLISDYNLLIESLTQQFLATNTQHLLLRTTIYNTIVDAIQEILISRANYQ